MPFQQFLNASTCVSCGVFGPVSSGKSSCISMLNNRPIGTMAKARATMSTTVYRDSKTSDPDTLKQQIEDVRNVDKLLRDEAGSTEKLQAALKNAMVQNIVNVPPFDLFECRSPAIVQFVDIPGLNDSSTKEVYYAHLKDIFRHLHALFLVFDINGAMNTNEEIEILRQVVKLTKEVREKYGLEQHLFVIANKCDEMRYNKDAGQLEFIEEEDKGLFEQLSSRVQEVVTEIHPGLKFDTLRISAENSFIYNSSLRNLHEGEQPAFNLDKKYKDKLGVAELGKKWHRLQPADQDERLRETLTPENIQHALLESGYTTFKEQLAEHFTPARQCTYLLNNLKVCVGLLVKEMQVKDILCYLATEKKTSDSADDDDDDDDDDFDSVEDASSYERGATFVHNMLQVCKQYELFEQHFEADAPQLFELSIFYDLVKAPLLDSVTNLLQLETLSRIGETIVPNAQELPQTVVDCETTARTVLCNVRQLIQETETLRTDYGNKPRSADVFGWSRVEASIREVLLTFYSKVTSLAMLPHTLVHEVISERVPQVERDFERVEMVNNLFNNTTLIAKPQDLTSAALLERSRTIVAYCVHYKDCGVFDEARRNRCLLEMIHKLYENWYTSLNVVIADVHFLPYFRTVKRLVWDFLVHSSPDHASVCARNTVFSKAIFLCDLHIQRQLNALVSSGKPLATGHELASIDPTLTMEYVCAQWYFPKAFQRAPDAPRSRNKRAAADSDERVVRIRSRRAKR